MTDHHDHDGCGHCGHCKWWQHDANGAADHQDIGLCLHDELAHFELEVSGDSGCNRYQPAEVPAAQGTA